LFPQWVPQPVAPSGMPQAGPLGPQREELVASLATPLPSGAVLAPRLEPPQLPPLELLPEAPFYQEELRPVARATSVASLLRPLAVVAPPPVVVEPLPVVEPVRPPVAVFVEPAPLPPASFPSALPVAVAPLARAASAVVSVSPPVTGGASLSLRVAERFNPLDLFSEDM
jgi:hypothetical protein